MHVASPHDDQIVGASEQSNLAARSDLREIADQEGAVGEIRRGVRQIALRHGRRADPQSPARRVDDEPDAVDGAPDAASFRRVALPIVGDPAALAGAVEDMHRPAGAGAECRRGRRRKRRPGGDHQANGRREIELTQSHQAGQEGRNGR